MHISGVQKDRFIRILYDGDCPVCYRKVAFLQRRDHKSKLHFLDIRASGFDPEKFHISLEAMEKQIHAILPDGTVISRMDVIRTAYREVGLGWLATPMGWPLIRPLLDTLYGFVAKHRYSISRFSR